MYIKCMYMKKYIENKIRPFKKDTDHWSLNNQKH